MPEVSFARHPAGPEGGSKSADEKGSIMSAFCPSTPSFHASTEAFHRHSQSMLNPQPFGCSKWMSLICPTASWVSRGLKGPFLRVASSHEDFVQPPLTSGSGNAAASPADEKAWSCGNMGFCRATLSPTPPEPGKPPQRLQDRSGQGSLLCWCPLAARFLQDPLQDRPVKEAEEFHTALTVLLRASSPSAVRCLCHPPSC